ncbi:MAG: DUF6702 family protein, partial [Rhodothermales bacterium]
MRPRIIPKRMISWLVPFLLVFILNDTPAVAFVSEAEADDPSAVERHDFHVSYSRLAVEGSTAVVRIRLFKDDLGQSLAAREGRDLMVDISPEHDSLFTAYFNESFVL